MSSDSSRLNDRPFVSNSFRVLLGRTILNNDFSALVLSLSLLIGTAAILFPSANQWMYWLYDDTEHLNIAYNLFHGKGLTIDFIDLDAAFKDTNIPVLSNYETISHPLQNKGPLYFVLLGSWLTATQADFSNWYFWGSILNFLFAASFVVVFYIFTKRYFGRTVAMYATPVLALMPALTWFSVRIRPEVLAYVFIVSAMYFAANSLTKRNVALSGLLSALAHLTHPIGLLSGAAYLVYLLYKRKLKLAILLVAVWSAVLMPWMVRNYLIFGDATQGLGIPIPKSVLFALGLATMNTQNSNLVNPDGISSLTGTEVFVTLAGMLKEFAGLYGMPFFMLFIACGIAAYLSFGSVRSALSSRKRLALFAAALGLWGVALGLSITAETGSAAIQAILLIVVPLVGFLYIKLFTRYRSTMTWNGNNAYTLIGILGVASLITYVMFAQLSSRTVPEIRIIICSMYLLLPVAIIGLSKLLEMPIKLLFSTKSCRKALTAAMISVLAIFSISQSVTGISSILAYQNEKAETGFDSLTNEWIRSNVPEGAHIATDLPHAVTLRTGHPSVNFYYEFKGDQSYEKWIIKKFDIDYLVFYFGYTPVQTVDLGDIRLKLVYNLDNNFVYQVGSVNLEPIPKSISGKQ